MPGKGSKEISPFKPIEEEIRTMMKFPKRFPHHKILTFIKEFLALPLNGNVDHDLQQTNGKTNKIFSKWIVKNVIKEYGYSPTYTTLKENAQDLSLPDDMTDNIVDLLWEEYLQESKKIAKERKF